MGVIPSPQKSLRQLAGRPLWMPIGFRGRGLPGSGGNFDATSNSINDLTIWQAPSFSAVRAIKLVYGGFDLSSSGPVDRGATVTGFTSVFLPGANTFTVYTAAVVATGATSFTALLGQGLQGNAVSAGMAISGIGIPSGTYVVSAVPAYTTSTGNLSGYTVTLSQATTAAIAASVALTVSGVLYPAKWGQRRQATIEPMRDVVVSDEIPVSLSAGQLFAVRGSWTFGQAGIALADYPAAASGSTRLMLGGITESSNRGSGLADATLTPLQPSNSGGGYWPPVAILGLLADSNSHAAALIIGDSIAAGTGDSADSSGRMGFVQKSLGNSLPWVSVARGSTSATQMQSATRGVYRLAVETGVTDVLLEYCRNDINAGVQLTYIKQALSSIAAPYLAAGIRVWVFTCPPSTSSTDAWATAANQAIPNASYETQRTAYNSDLRANWASYGYAGLMDIASTVEDPANPGKWRTNGGAWTADGVHPNVLGHSLLVGAKVITPGMFVL